LRNYKSEVSMLYILLPAYNEEEGLEKLLERIDRITKSFSIPYKLIIINDGSVDHTVAVIESYSKIMPIELISLKPNQGITEVFKIGFNRVCETARDEDICITMDSDNTQNPYVMLDIINRLNQSYDVVIASRFQKGGGMVGAPFIREMMSRGVAFIFRKLSPIAGVTDYSTFYRGYSVRVLKQALSLYGDDLVQGYGFSSMASILIKLHKITEKFSEVPFVLRYDLKEGGSGMKVPKTIKGYLRIFWQIKTGKL